MIDSLVGEGVSSASVKLDLNSLGLGMLAIALAYLLREVFNGLRIRVNNTVEQGSSRSQAQPARQTTRPSSFLL